MSDENTTPEADAFERAESRLEEAGGEAWKPIKNPKECPARIVVRVSRVGERTVNTSQGPTSAIVVTGSEKDGRVWDVWCWHTVLHNEMAAAEPQPGDVIAVEYFGKKTPTGGGNSYESYKVVRADDKAGSTFHWSSVNTSAADDFGAVDPLPSHVIYEQPEQPEPATPEPATPEPATPEPAAPEPAAPEPAAPPAYDDIPF